MSDKEKTISVSSINDIDDDDVTPENNEDGDDNNKKNGDDSNKKNGDNNTYEINKKLPTNPFTETSKGSDEPIKNDEENKQKKILEYQNLIRLMITKFETDDSDILREILKYLEKQSLKLNDPTEEILKKMSSVDCKKIYNHYNAALESNKIKNESKNTTESTKLTEEEEKRNAWLSLQMIKYNQARLPLKMIEKDAMRHQYKFWEIQQVLKPDYVFVSERRMKKIKKYDLAKDVKNTPPRILIRKKGKPLDRDIFEWDHNISLEELSKFMNENYFEEVIHKVTYNLDFLKWVFNNATKNYFIAIRCRNLLYQKIMSIYSRDTIKYAKPSNSKKTIGDIITGYIDQKTYDRMPKGKIIGVITGKVQKLRIFEKEQDVLRGMFLTIDEKLRNKGFSPLLITELKRTVLLDSKGKVDVGLFNTDRFVPTPFVGCNLYHRYINNIERLLDEKIIVVKKGESRTERINLSALPSKTATVGLEPLSNNNIDEAYKFYSCKNLQNVYPIFNTSEFKSTFMGDPKVIKTYIIRESSSDDIIDFISYIMYDYTLLNPIDKSKNKVKIALLYYSFFSTINPMSLTVKDMMILAKKDGCEIFNMFNIMDFFLMTDELKAEDSERRFFYNFYNYKCVKIKEIQMGYIGFE